MATTEQAAREPILTFPRRSFTDPAWLQDQAEARAHRLTVGQLRNFKRRQRLPLDQRLSATARELLALEQETAERVANGEQRERAQALQLIAQRATPEAAQALAAIVPEERQLFHAQTGWVSDWDVERYLKNRVEGFTGKAYAVPTAACKRAAKLAPAAAPFAPAERFRRILFWGVILRLDQLEGPPPADPVAFYSWCQLEAYAAHDRYSNPTARHDADPMASLADALTGRMRSTDARALLQLPETGPLDPAAIRSAYRSHARQHHPDQGGDRQRFERLTAARDRLLLEVAA
jgi:hypothetical protein